MNISDADILVDKADKLVMQKCFPIAGSKYEEANELLNQAASKYKLAKDFNNAINSYTKIIDNLNKMKDVFIPDIINVYYELIKCYRNIKNSNKIIETNIKLIGLCEYINKYSEATKCAQEIAEIYEKDRDMTKSIEYYLKCCEYKLLENGKEEACHKYYVKLAELNALSERYLEAINYYDKVIPISIDSNLLKYNVKTYIFNSLLCSCCLDIADAKIKLTRYCEIDASFDGSTEYKHMLYIISDIENNDIQSFLDHVSSYDNISSLSPLRTQLLVKIKSNINNCNLKL